MIWEVLIEKVSLLLFSTESWLVTNIKRIHFFFAVLFVVLLNLSPQLFRQELECGFFFVVVILREFVSYFVVE